MKHQIIWLFIALAFQVNAQNEIAGKKVNEAFGKSTIEKMSTSEIEWQNFLAENMCTVNELPSGKNATYPEIDLSNNGSLNPSEITTENFNPLVAGITPLQSEHQHFKISGTNKVLFVFSLDRLKVLYSRYQTNQKKS